MLEVWGIQRQKDMVSDLKELLDQVTALLTRIHDGMVKG